MNPTAHNPASQTVASATHAHLSASKGRALMLTSVAFFIANALTVRLLGARFAVDSWTLSTARFVIGLVVVAALSFDGRRVGRVSIVALFRNPLLVTRGVVGGTAVYLYYVTFPTLGAGRSTFINNTYIVWGALLATIFLREKLRPAVAASLVLGAIGVAMLGGFSLDLATISRADVHALLGAIGSGIVIVVIRKLHQRETTATIFAAQCSWGLAFSAVPTVAHGQMPAVAAIALLVLTGLLASAGQLTMTSAYRHLPVAEGSLLQMLVPLGIGVGGMIFFSERYTALEGAGAVLTIASCLIATLSRPRLAAGLPPNLQREPTTAPSRSEDRGA